MTGPQGPRVTAADKKALRNQLVERRPSAIVGDGLFAMTSFRRGDAVASYDGKLITEEEGERRFAEGDPVALYHQGFRGGYVVPDVASLGAHLANHSCAPNTLVDAVPFHDRPVMIAMTDIAAGDELTQWYGWVHKFPMQCRCGYRRCLGTIGWKPGAMSNIEVDRIATMAMHNDNWLMLEALVAPSPAVTLPYLEARHPTVFAWFRDRTIFVARMRGLIV